MDLWTSVDSIKPAKGKQGDSPVVTVNASSLRETETKKIEAYTNDSKVQVSVSKMDPKCQTMELKISIDQAAEAVKKSIIIEISPHSQMVTIGAKLIEAEFEVEKKS